MAEWEVGPMGGVPGSVRMWCHETTMGWIYTRLSDLVMSPETNVAQPVCSLQR